MLKEMKTLLEQSSELLVKIGLDNLQKIFSQLTSLYIFERKFANN